MSSFKNFVASQQQVERKNVFKLFLKKNIVSLTVVKLIQFI